MIYEVHMDGFCWAVLAGRGEKWFMREFLQNLRIPPLSVGVKNTTVTMFYTAEESFFIERSGWRCNGNPGGTWKHLEPDRKELWVLSLRVKEVITVQLHSDSRRWWWGWWCSHIHPPVQGQTEVKVKDSGFLVGPQRPVNPDSAGGGTRTSLWIHVWKQKLFKCRKFWGKHIVT